MSNAGISGQSPDANPSLTCAGCGACCRVTPVPPFESGEALQRAVPPEWLESAGRRLADGSAWEVSACVWFDPDSGRCRHYEFRPTACRDFQVGGSDCRRVQSLVRFPSVETWQVK